MRIGALASSAAAASILRGLSGCFGAWTAMSPKAANLFGLGTALDASGAAAASAGTGAGAARCASGRAAGTSAGWDQAWHSSSAKGSTRPGAGVADSSSTNGSEGPGAASAAAPAGAGAGAEASPGDAASASGSASSGPGSASARGRADSSATSAQAGAASATLSKASNSMSFRAAKWSSISCFRASAMEGMDSAVWNTSKTALVWPVSRASFSFAPRTSEAAAATGPTCNVARAEAVGGSATSSTATAGFASLGGLGVASAASP
mmetsp:Transcript_113198/g.243874  ORF Transcript_113198/g.243874 Transcript_113198/m.243874 type:complete len:265 (+) Transcript_113198:830-1624(+)